MLTLQIVATEAPRVMLQAYCEVRGWGVSTEAADLALVERGQPPPAAGLALFFSAAELPQLFECLNVLSRAPEAAAPSFLLGRKQAGYTMLDPRTVRYFRTEGHLVYAETLETAYEVERKLYELETAFRAHGFIRIGKAHIVNLLWVGEIIPWFGGRLLLKLKEKPEELEVARSYVRDFREMLGM
jgi:DNA-binding LytR/AlgR family response regulator